MNFDPYHKWLGIPSEEQPPHHYRLLGVKPFETDLDVIDSAADRQMLHLRTHQTGPRAVASQKLMNEVSAARACLLVADAKAAYDAQLHQRLRESSTGAPPPQEDLFDELDQVPAPAATSHGKPQAPVRPTARHLPAHEKSGMRPTVLLGIAGGVLAALLIVVILVFSQQLSTPISRSDEQTDKDSILAIPMDDAVARESSWFLDDEEIRTSRHAVAPGEYKLRGLRPGYNPIERSIVLKPGETIHIHPQWIALENTGILDDPPDNFDTTNRVAEDAGRQIKRQLVQGGIAGAPAKSEKTADPSTTAAPTESVPEASTTEKHIAEDSSKPTDAANDNPSAPGPQGPIDLMALIDPERHSINGRYLREGPTLVTPSTLALPLMVIPLELPDEYDISVTVERLSHENGFWLFLSRGATRFDVGVDTWGQKASGFQTIDSKRVHVIDGRYDGPVLQAGNPVRLDIAVRRNSLILQADGRKLMEYHGDNGRLGSLHPELEGSPFAYLGGSRAAFRVSEFTLTPVTGKAVPSPIDYSQPITFNGHSYRRLPDPVTWREAVLRCQALGGHLVCVETKEEHEFIEKHLQFRQWVWVGGHRTPNNKWHWLSGEPFEYAPWKQGEPNGKRPTQSAIVLHAGGLMGDNYNTCRQSFICEWPTLTPRPGKPLAEQEYPLRQRPRTDSVSSPLRFGNHAYALVSSALSWHDAKLACEEMGGYLCVVETQAEHAFLARMLPGNESVWLGATDEHDEGDFRWINGAPFSFTAWGASEPNNFQLGSEHYLTMNAKSKLWFDQSGAWPHKFLCEWDTPSPAFFRRR